MRDFTPEEAAYLEGLEAVTAVEGGRRIRYAPGFRAEALERYARGEAPAAIFRRAGMPPELVGRKRIEDAMRRWSGSDPAVARRRAASRPQAEVRSEETLSALLIDVIRAPAARVPTEERYGIMLRIEDRLGPYFHASAACKALGVSPSGYRAWRAEARP